MTLLRVALAGIAFWALLATAATLADEAKTDHQLIQGAWRLVKITESAQHEEVLQDDAGMVFKGDELVMMRNGQEMDRGTFKLDESKTPKEIDLISPKGHETSHGIYKIEGGTLTICISEKDHPKDFVPRKDNLVEVFTRQATSGTASGPAPKPWPQSMPAYASGKILRIEGNNLILNARERIGPPMIISVTTDDQTEFSTRSHGAGSLTDLRRGMSVNVSVSSASGGTQKTKVFASLITRSGTVVRVEGKNVIVDPGFRGSKLEMTVTTDERTKVFLNTIEDGKSSLKEISLKDLEPGMRVDIKPETDPACEIETTVFPALTKTAATKPK